MVPPVQAPVAEVPGLKQFQEAAWQPATQTQPPLNEAISPDLQQAIGMVNADKPILQFRTLAQPNAAVTALVHLPSGCRPLSLISWHPAGTHISLICDSVAGSGLTVSACIVRVLDKSVQKIQIERLPPGSPRPASFVLPTAWAPNAPTLLVCRINDEGQTQTCFRRAHLKSVGCQLVYLDIKGHSPRCLQWVPNSTLVAFGTDNLADVIMYRISSGASTAVQPRCGDKPMVCCAPDSSHLLVAGTVGADGTVKAAFISTEKPHTASVPETLTWKGMVRQVAWGSQNHAAISSIGEQHGKVAVYTVTSGPELQPLHELNTGRFLEDLSFSPSGTYISVLDQGNSFSTAALTQNYLVTPNNEVVVLHLPSLQARWFGKRQHSTHHEMNEYQNPKYGEVFHIGWPGKALLSWARQGTSLLVFGPGYKSSKQLPGRFKSMMSNDKPGGQHVAMPSDRLDLSEQS